MIVRKIWEVDLTYKSGTGMTRAEWHAYVCGNRTRFAIAFPSLLVIFTGLWHLPISQDQTLPPSTQWAIAFLFGGVITPGVLAVITLIAWKLSDWIRGQW